MRICCGVGRKQPSGGTEIGASVAEEIGAEQVILNDFPGAVENSETLEKMIRCNGEQLLDMI